jgi:GNAT superfamily N-acetyltransferase
VFQDIRHSKIPCKISVCDAQDIAFIPETYDTEFAQFAKRKKPEVWFVARDVSSNRVMGTGCLLILSKERVRSSNDFVIPEYRGNGIIKDLVVARENYARERGYKVIDVRTLKKYYGELGYEVIKNYKTVGSWLEKMIRQ